MTHPDPDPDPDQYFVLIWREPDASRLRTFTTTTSPTETPRPIAVRLKDVAPQPPPGHLITTPEALNEFLAIPSDDVDPADTRVLLDTLARSELGWDPQRF